MRWIFKSFISHLHLSGFWNKTRFPISVHAEKMIWESCVSAIALFLFQPKMYFKRCRLVFIFNSCVVLWWRVNVLHFPQLQLCIVLWRAQEFYLHLSHTYDLYSHCFLSMRILKWPLLLLGVLTLVFANDSSFCVGNKTNHMLYGKRKLVNFIIFACVTHFSYIQNYLWTQKNMLKIRLFSMCEVHQWLTLSPEVKTT